MTVTTTVGDLSRTLRLAALFADDPDLSPFPTLSAVFIEADGGTLTATATDRYKLGHARTTATGNLPSDGVLIPVRWATWIADGLDHLADHEEVTLDATGVDVNRLKPGTLQVTAAGMTATVPTTGTPPNGHGADLRGNWINYPRIFGEIPFGGSGAGKPVLLAPQHVGVLAQVDEIVPMTCSRWTAVDPLKAVRVEVGNALTALLMPINSYQYAAKHWPIPVGVPTPVPA